MAISSYNRELIRHSLRGVEAIEANDDRKRILLLDHTAALGGGEVALLNLVQYLDPNRYKPIVLLCSNGPLADRLQEAGIETHIMPLSKNVLDTRKDTLGGKTLLRFRDGVNLIRFVLRVARFIKDNKIDLVHANSLKADIIGGVASRLSGRPVIWHVRDHIENDYLPNRVVSLFRKLCRIIPDYVVANSDATLKTLDLPGRGYCATIHSGINLNRRGVVHDGIEDGLYDMEQSANKRTYPLIGIVGRISPWKGQDIFLRAAAIVRESHPDVRFQIIGAALFNEREYEGTVRKLCSSLGLDSAVEFTGFRNDVPDLINNLDILVHASTTGEPFGQVVIEGMAAGKPVIATNGGGIPEIVEDGITGKLVPMGDHVALANAIHDILSDQVAAELMGMRGRQRVREKFTIEHTAAKVSHVYDELLSSRKASRKPGEKAEQTIAAS